MLNNVIGREIGKTTSIDSTSKDIAKKVLDYYYTNGLNILKETDDGYYVIVKERLSYERYKDDLIILETLDENGFPPDNKYLRQKEWSGQQTVPVQLPDIALKILHFSTVYG